MSVRGLVTSFWRAVRRVARVAGPRAEELLLNEVMLLKTLGLRHTVRWNRMLAAAWSRDYVRRHRYVTLSQDELRAMRRSDTMFVFGSGQSLNEITPAEWEHFAQHGVLGFNAFTKQRWIPVDFHILRGALYDELRWRPYAEEVGSELASNPCFAKTVYVLQEGYFAQHGNQLVGYGLLPTGARVARYHTVPGWGPPTRTLAEGLRHTVGTLDDAVNLAVCLGAKEIVLVGVDLYDSRYFWLPDDETIAFDPRTGGLRGAEIGINHQRFDEPHNTARSGVVRLMAEWREALEPGGIRLCIYNPRSLLAEVLPLYERLDDPLSADVVG